ncbi:MAG TPA: NAD(P)(+) transhydrogenase (Re/Si-specific) subunit beta, partial [Candidatus Eisenbacteria bacterium]
MESTAQLPVLFHFSYLLSAILFIVGLKFLSAPARARYGNLLAALGMTVAGLTTLGSLWVPGS